jgi:hypothetical protein
VGGGGGRGDEHSEVFDSLLHSKLKYYDEDMFFYKIFEGCIV